MRRGALRCHWVLRFTKLSPEQLLTFSQLSPREPCATKANRRLMIVLQHYFQLLRSRKHKLVHKHFTAPIFLLLFFLFVFFTTSLHILQTGVQPRPYRLFNYGNAFFRRKRKKLSGLFRSFFFRTFLIGAQVSFRNNSQLPDFNSYSYFLCCFFSTYGIFRTSRIDIFVYFTFAFV